MTEITETPRLLNRAQAAKVLTELGHNIAPKTLAKLAVVGGGPPFRKQGRYPRYEISDLQEFARSKLSRKVRSNAELRA